MMTHTAADSIQTCSITEGDFRGWRAYFLRNGLVTLVAVPDIGGRIMAYDLGDYPYIFVDPDLAGRLFTPEENQGDGSMAAWKNYGGDKTWPSPQGWDTDEQWPGPPDPVLDSGRYQVTARESGAGTAVLAMTSPPDPRTGVQITRRISLLADSSRVRLDLSFTNTVDRPIRWSIWDVLQLQAGRTLPDGSTTFDPDCVVSAPINPRSRFKKGFNVMFGDPDNPQWTTDPQKGLFLGRYRYEIGKVGLDSPAGWIAFSRGSAGYAFAERFEHFPGQEYPDQGATVECWTVGSGRVANLDYENSGIYLMEIEALSPFFDFAPGETRSFTLEWGACRCPGPVQDVQPAGCTGEPLQVSRVGDRLRLTGAFGVFEPGELELAWIDRAGGTLALVSLGPVEPTAAVILDQTLALPEGAVLANLQVAARSDAAWRLLAQAELPR